MTDPSIVPRNALEGLRVALSVSESADLPRLGLTPRHCDLVVAEVARAVIIAGGTVVYGGRLKPEGFTGIFLEEAGRFREKNNAVELVISESEFTSLSNKDLTKVDQRLGSAGSLTLVGADGEIVRLVDVDRRRGGVVDTASALTAMRRHVAARSHARVVVGGKLSQYLGSEPGVIEEARLSAESSTRLYIAGGYGGAAAAILNRVEPSLFSRWAPPGFPYGVEAPEVVASLDRFAESYSLARKNGLGPEEQQLLAASYRPADIATLVVRGLATSP